MISLGFFGHAPGAPRRTRAPALFGGALLVALLGGATEARAADSLAHRRSLYATPQHFALELRFSPYKPQIDDEPGLRGKPYQTTFGTMPRLLFGGELDWQALRIPHVGTLGPGLGVGYTNMSDTARLLRDGSLSGDDTSLDIWSLYTVAVLRVDVLWRDAGVPLVPYVKGGLGLGLWRASNTGGTAEVKTATGTVRGEGHTFGTHVAGGLALALDFLDPGASRSMDQTVGINNTYFYAEYYLSMLNGIGQTAPLRVGANSWTMGLTFEF
ncbi:MAG TPA: MXAN_2562 family outer membrane beta-barrel protein [Polyangiaceae bacterium]|jgi:hypothetical protein|nr:MXAN_2562 family outer membrane beta-barrel protein [Polyangiaceae bacterium]